MKSYRSVSGVNEDGDRRDACPTFGLGLVTGLRAERYDPADLGCYKKRFYEAFSRP